MTATRLYRSTRDYIIAGVCGGLGRSLGVDPAFIRLFFVLGIWAGFSMLLYPILWLILPREDRPEATTREAIEAGASEMAEKAEAFRNRLHAAPHGRELPGLLLGGGLVLLGLAAFAETTHLFWLSAVTSNLVWPLLLIAGGAALIQRRTRAA